MGDPDIATDFGADANGHSVKDLGAA